MDYREYRKRMRWAAEDCELAVEEGEMTEEEANELLEELEESYIVATEAIGEMRLDR